MGQLRVFLLGRFRATWNGLPLAGLEHQKVQELFAYLLLHPNQHHHRDKLAALLWEDGADLSLSRKYLRKSLWKLRGALAPTAAVDDLIQVDCEWLGLRGNPDVWSDVTAVERAAGIGRSRHDNGFSPEEIDSLRAAVDLNRGQFMEGLHPEWCLFERERFQLMQIGILDRLMAHFEAQGELETGCDFGLQILQIDAARERTHRRLMRNYFVSGNRAAALRQYEQCVRILEEEFGLPPGGKTRALYQQIIQDEVRSPQPRPERAGFNRLAEEIRELKGMILTMSERLDDPEAGRQRHT